jgi:FkbM family methyltransferase
VALLLSFLNRMPASWIRAAAALRGKSRLVKRMTDWLPDRLRNRDGVIQKGLGRGLRFNGGDSAVGFLLGTHDLEVQRAFQQFLRPGMVVYDIGANVGFTAVLAAKQVGPSGQVICFEPLPKNAEQIRRNAALNDFGTISMHQFALGERDGDAEFQRSRSPTWGRLVQTGVAPSASDFLKVPMRSLDSLAGNDGLPPPDFIKMDVEGAEADVLHGAQMLLRQARPVLVIELHHTYRAVVEALDGLNYTVHVLTPGVTSLDGEFQIVAHPAADSDSVAN